MLCLLRRCYWTSDHAGTAGSAMSSSHMHRTHGHSVRTALSACIVARHSHCSSRSRPTEQVIQARMQYSMRHAPQQWVFGKPTGFPVVGARAARWCFFLVFGAACMLTPCMGACPHTRGFSEKPPLGACMRLVLGKPVVFPKTTKNHCAPRARCYYMPRAACTTMYWGLCPHDPPCMHAG